MKFADELEFHGSSVLFHRKTAACLLEHSASRCLNIMKGVRLFPVRMHPKLRGFSQTVMVSWTRFARATADRSQCLAWMKH